MDLLTLTHAVRTTPAGGRLLDGVSVSLQAGQRIALSGPSGSGKTVLLRTLAWLDELRSGNLQWRGVELTRKNIARFRSGCIYLHQRPWLLAGTVEHSLREPFTMKVHREKSFDRSKVLDWLQQLGRGEDFLDKPTERLSGGERQLAALLRAVQLEPQILLLDEPTAGLDQVACQSIEGLVREWAAADSERAFVWTSHDPAQLHRVANAAWRISNGRLVEAGK